VASIWRRRVCGVKSVSGGGGEDGNGRHHGLGSSAGFKSVKSMDRYGGRGR